MVKAMILSAADEPPSSEQSGNGIRIGESDAAASDGTGDGPAGGLTTLGGWPLVEFAPVGSAADGLTLGGKPLVDLAPGGSWPTIMERAVEGMSRRR